MAVKSVIDLELDQAQFARFLQEFNKFKAAAEKLPSFGKATAKEFEATRRAFADLNASIRASPKALREITEEQGTQLRQLQQHERLWTSISSKAKSFAGDIFAATRHLVSWGTLTGIGGGLLGVGSLFGIGTLARTAGDERRAATGLGMTIGQQRAFQINFSRLGNPDAYLSWINQMETDPTKSWSANALGVGLTGNTEGDAVAMLRAIRARAQATPLSMLGLLPKQFGLEGVDVEYLRNLRKMSGAEFGGLISDNTRDINRTNIPDDVARGWQDLIKTLEEAKSSIFATLVRGLAPLREPLQRLSEGFEHFTQVLLKSDLVKDAIEGLAHWMKDFSGRISSREFLSSFEEFTVKVRGLLQDLSDLGDVLHIIAHPLQSADKYIAGGAVGAIISRQEFEQNPTVAGYQAMLARGEASMGLPRGLLDYQFYKESSRQFFPKDSPKGAMGPLGITQPAADWLTQQFGTKIDPRDPMSAALGALEYDKLMSDKYHGDVRKVLASYNMGPKALDDALAVAAKAGRANDWLQYTPKETQGYVSGALISGAGMNITVTVNAPPGHDVSVSTNQLQH